MNDFSRRIKNLEDRLGVGTTEIPLLAIVRAQKCLEWFYSHPEATKDEMDAFARENSKTDTQYTRNCQIFARLADERKNGRTFDTRKPGLS
jgi:hypothetical protein